MVVSVAEEELTDGTHGRNRVPNNRDTICHRRSADPPSKRQRKVAPPSNRNATSNGLRLDSNIR